MASCVITTDENKKCFCDIIQNILVTGTEAAVQGFSENTSGAMSMFSGGGC